MEVIANGQYLEKKLFEQYRPGCIDYLVVHIYC